MRPPNQKQPQVKKGLRRVLQHVLVGCVRLTLFRNKNTWGDDLERYVWRF